MKTTYLIAALSLLGCEEPSWTVVHPGLDEGLLSVWGRSSSDVWIVGGDVGAGPLVMHYDGEVWTRLETGQTGDLWWVNGPEREGPVLFGGADGMILEYDDGEFTRHETPGTGTVFGIWAASPTDVWAVGGFGATAGFAWHYDGTAWTAVDLPDIGTRGLFKVWGTASDDVWLVGAMGAMYHWDGAMNPVDSGTMRTLFTVHVDADRAIAVGGASTAALVERDGDAWIDRSPQFVSQLNGIWNTSDPDEQAWAVGHNGTVMVRTDDGWIQEDVESLTRVRALHAVWVDELGGVWTVGGEILSAPLSNGILAHRGTQAPSSVIEEGL